MIRFKYALLFTAANLAGPALAAQPAPAAERQCSLPAYTNAWNKPVTPVVRAAPSLHAQALGRLVPERPEGEDHYRGVDVEITGVSGAWVRIAPITKKRGDEGVASPGGWIPARDVGFTMQTRLGFAEPDPAAAVVHTDDDWIYRNMIHAILDCRGSDWLKLDLQTRKGKHVTGWFRGICAVQETTCDGVQGDAPSNARQP